MSLLRQPSIFIFILRGGGGIKEVLVFAVVVVVNYFVVWFAFRFLVCGFVVVLNSFQFVDESGLLYIGMYLVTRSLFCCEFLGGNNRFSNSSAQKLHLSLYSASRFWTKRTWLALH